MKVKYELTVVLPADDDEAVKEIKSAVVGFVEKNNGRLEKKESWGIRELAYPIRKQTKALYEHFVFEVDAEKQPKLNKMLSLNERVMRYLFVRV